MANNNRRKIALELSMSGVTLRGACSAPPPGSRSRTYRDAFGSGATSQRREREDVYAMP
jgi:hypothetical protein